MMNNKRQLTIVTWEDAWQDQENFATAHGIKQTHEPMLVVTKGDLLVDDEAGVSIANEHSLQDGKDVYRGRSFIPRAMIKTVETYNLTKPRIKKFLGVSDCRKCGKFIEHDHKCQPIEQENV